MKTARNNPARKVKARIMYGKFIAGEKCLAFWSNRLSGTNEIPVAVLPVDDEEALIKTVAVALDWEDGTGVGHEGNAAAVLASIGISTTLHRRILKAKRKTRRAAR